MRTHIITGSRSPERSLFDKDCALFSAPLQKVSFILKARKLKRNGTLATVEPADANLAKEITVDRKSTLQTYAVDKTEGKEETEEQFVTTRLALDYGDMAEEAFVTRRAAPLKLLGKPAKYVFFHIRNKILIESTREIGEEEGGGAA
ncbi:unnamed protein product [Strongylus vulgaris]|uniref:Uncharacterized protein n=1 Tax=Strongylus vulgaris TaxID=40348 RepID=A0A3P7KRN1_STRVU|nr:unnamed protein product [Strongylus vulgaris]